MLESQNLVIYIRTILKGSIVASVALYLFLSVGIFRFPDQLIYDSRFPTGDPILNEIVLVNITDRSVGQFGNWPWDRFVFVRAINNILSGEPAVVAIDVIFASERGGLADAQLAQLAASNKNLVFATIDNGLGLTDNLYPALAKATPQVGFVNRIRNEEYEEVVALGAGKWPSLRSLPEVVAQAYMRSKGEEVSSEVPLIRLGAHPLYPTYGALAWPINFAGPIESIKTIPIEEVVSSGFDPLKVKKKIVIIGAVGYRYGDIHQSPLARGVNTPGPVIVAYGINTILSGRKIHTMSYVGLLSSVLVFCIFISLVFSALRSSYWVLFSSICSLAVIQTALFLQFRYHFPIMPFATGVIGSFVLCSRKIIGPSAAAYSRGNQNW